MPRAPSPPRRSSRAKAPSVQPSQSTSSSTSTSTSTSSRPNATTNGIDRTTRAKQSSPQKSTTPQGRDSDDAQSRPDPPVATRRSGRRAMDEANGRDRNADEIIEDEETTRCVCGFQDYPGQPLEPGAQPAQRTKGADVDGAGEEPGSLFIQCDTCEVWQHGGCVGIMKESETPDNYFCEACRPDFHRLARTANGQKYSRYLPVTAKSKSLSSSSSSSHRKTSVTKDWETRAAKEAERALKATADSTKRRSTMNSRAAYDEDEVLRKVLEESKVDGHLDPSEASQSRKGKRLREESEDQRSDIKRQRTYSNAGSPAPSAPPSNADSNEQDEDAKKKQAPRGAAARSQREREQREKDRERAEAANKRKGRADRRRADEPDLAEEDSAETPTANGDDAPTPNANPDVTTTTKESSIPAPTNNTTNPTTSNNIKRPPAQSRSVPKRGRSARSGALDSTDSPNHQSTAHEPSHSPAPGSGSGADNSSTGAAPTQRRGRPAINGNGVREPSMAEMRKRAGMMLEMVAQCQVEMARAEGKGFAIGSGGGGGGGAKDGAAGLAGALATRLVKWQREFLVEAGSDEVR